MAVRRADAAYNDARILDAAREVFGEQGANAPVSAIARRAGTGIGSLYRRFPSKESLFRQLLLATIDDSRERAERAMDVSDPWAALRDFVLGCVDSGGLPADPGPLAVTDELVDASRRAREAVAALLRRAQDAGVARGDVNAHDVVTIITQLRRLRASAGNARIPSPSHDRFHRIVVAGLRAHDDGIEDLGPGPVDWAEIRGAWVVDAGDP